MVTGSATTPLKWYYIATSTPDAATASGWTIGKGQQKSGTSFVDFSDNAYLQIRVRGVVANSRATGGPTITWPNVVRVPATLGVTFDGILDRNGTTRIEDTVLYNWRRFPGSGGVTPEVASIGTGPTYTLTDADAGKKVSVQVWFSDDVGYIEGPQNKTTGGRVIGGRHTARRPR